MNAEDIRLPPVRKSLPAPVVLPVMLLLVLTSLAVASQPASAGSSDSAGWTVELGGSGTATKISLSSIAGELGAGESATWAVSTPINSGTGASNLSIDSPSNETLWNWSGPFGYADSFTQGHSLVVSNSSTEGILTVPTAATSNATLTVSSVDHALSGAYTLGVAAGPAELVSLTGAQPYTPFQVLPWGLDPNLISQISVTSTPTGNTLLAVGDGEGEVSLYDVSPGIAGVPVYSTELVLGRPITALDAAQFFQFGPPSVVAASGSSVSFIEANNSGIDAWHQYNLDLASTGSGGNTATITSISPLLYSDGNPGLIVGTSSGWTYLSNWNAGAWSGPLQPFIYAGTQAPVTLSTWQSPTGSNLVATCAGPLLNIWNVSLAGETAVQQVSVLGNQTLVDPVFSPNGTEVSFASRSGGIFDLQIGSSQPPKEIYQASTQVVGLSAGPGSSAGSGYLTLDNGSVAVLPSLFGLPSGPVFLTDGNLTLTSAPAVGSIFEPGAPDILLPSGSALLAAESTQIFTQTEVGSWPQTLATLLAESTPVNTGTVVPEYRVPLTLWVTGGTVDLSTFMTYNASLTAGVPAALSGLLVPGAGSPFLWVRASGAGEVHIAITIHPAPSAIAASATWLTSWLEKNGIWLAGGMALLGGGLLLVGWIGKSTKGRSPRTSPVPVGRPDEGVESNPMPTSGGLRPPRPPSTG